MDATPIAPAPPHPARQLPLVLAVTFVVCVVPAFVAPRLVTADGIRSVIASVVLTLALSAGAAQLGAAAWSRRPRPDDTLFADLLLGRWLGVHWREQRLSRLRAGLIREPPSPRPGRLAALARVGLLLEARDRNVYGHSRRVARYALGIARALHLPADEVETIRQAALVHDVGKIYTPREILDKPGRLTDAEFDVIKRHPADGGGLLEASTGPEIRALVRHHHERLDGGGYPDGLAGDDIPMGARVIAVADTFDALTSTRPYRPAATHQQALEVLRSEAGSQLDGDAVAAFLRVYSARRPVALTAALGTVGARLADRAVSSLSQAGAALQAVPAIGAAIALAGAPASEGATRGHPAAAAPHARHALRASAPAPATHAAGRRSAHATRGSAPARRPTTHEPTRRSGRGTRSPRRTTAPAGAVTASAATTPGSDPAIAGGPSAPTPAQAAPTTIPSPTGAVITPAVTTPAVTTPAVTTPAITTPAITTPAVSTPSLTTAGVTIPVVSVPTVTVPSIAAPVLSAPAASLP